MKKWTKEEKEREIKRQQELKKDFINGKLKLER
jgi:hypothetical protein